jgi:chaperone modulatory protein CbpM
MHMATPTVIVVTTTPNLVVEEHVVFSFAALCRAAGADHHQLVALVAEGLLHPSDGSEEKNPEDWHFAGPSLLLARRTLQLARELQISLHGAAIVLDLLSQIDALKARQPSPRDAAGG